MIRIKKKIRQWLDVEENNSHSNYRIKVKLKRGNDTRDQESIHGTVEENSLEEAQEGMEELKENMEEWAKDFRSLQPDNTEFVTNEE